MFPPLPSLWTLAAVGGPAANVRVTACVAAVLIFFVTVLALEISRRRFTQRIGPGMQGDSSFVRLQRAHGNALEHVPLVLIGLLLLELRGERGAVEALGVLFVLSRLSHAGGFLIRPRHPLHPLGAVLTYAVEVAIVALLIRSIWLHG